MRLGKDEQASDRRLVFDLEADEVPIFLADVDEHLQIIEGGVLCLERAPTPGILQGIFRAAHTLKALAATIGHSRMAELTHALESLFEALREGRAALAPAAADDLLEAIDVLGKLRNEVVSHVRSDVAVDSLIARLNALLTADHIATHPSPDDGQRLLEIELSAHDTFASGALLYQAVTALAEQGRIVSTQPALDELVDTTSSLQVVLATAATRDKIVESLAELVEISVESIERFDPRERTSTQPTVSSEKMVRISIERLDVLMNLVGELVMDRTRLTQLTSKLANHQSSQNDINALDDVATHLTHIVSQLQDEVMHARLLPIGNLFEKFPRLVRDTSRALGRQVELQIKGAHTELDRSIIEGLSDPLMHLVRNAIDHAIEPAAERIGAGKPPSGTIQLSAGQQNGHINIIVADDGRGIDPVRIRRAAVARGILAEDEVAQFDDDAIINLIFQPRFSTASQVTALSGRGIGLDVVRTQVEQMNGTVTLESKNGRGTTFRITVPLTLTIVPTMLVLVGENIFAIPLASIIDMWSLSDVALGSVSGNPTMVWRDTVLPLLELRRMFAHPRLRESTDPIKPAVLTVGWAKLRAGLVVDRIIGQQEIVAKGLSPIIGTPPGISGSATLGDGRIALIVDVPALLKSALQNQFKGG